MKWQSLFTSSKDKAWKKAALELGARYEKKNFWHSSRLFYDYQKWTFLLDTYTHQDSNLTRTRLMVPYVTNDQLRFNFYHADFFSTLSKFFGMQDIQIHDLFFDEKFILQGSDESQVKRLLADDSIRRLLMQMNDLSLEIVDNDGVFSSDHPTNVLFIKLTRTGVIKDADDIKTMFRLFTKLLDRMVDIGAALHYYPNFSMQ